MVPKSLFAVLIILSIVAIIAQMGFNYYFPFREVLVVFILLLIFLTVEEVYSALLWAVPWFCFMVTTGNDGGFRGLWSGFIAFLESFKHVKY